MHARRDQYRSSFGAFTARERDLARSRARRDALDPASAPAVEHTDAPRIAAPAPSVDVAAHGAGGR